MSASLYAIPKIHDEGLERPLEAISCAPDNHQRFIGDFLCSVRIVRDASCEMHQLGEILPVQLLKSLHVPFGDGGQKRLICFRFRSFEGRSNGSGYMHPECSLCYLQYKLPMVVKRFIVLQPSGGKFCVMSFQWGETARANRRGKAAAGMSIGAACLGWYVGLVVISA